LMEWNEWTMDSSYPNDEMQLLWGG
jgi:hypothetical protein